MDGITNQLLRQEQLGAAKVRKQKVVDGHDSTSKSMPTMFYAGGGRGGGRGRFGDQGGRGSGSGGAHCRCRCQERGALSTVGS